MGQAPYHPRKIVEVRLANLWRRLSACRRGNVAVIFALSLPMVIGAAGAGVETTYWFVRSQQLQSAADAAAYAAAIEKRSGADAGGVLTVATVTAEQNGAGDGATTQVSTPTEQSVQVTLTAEEP